MSNSRADWLAERRTLITASDAAAILGVDPWRGPLAVYAEKLGIETVETKPMRWGRRVEGAIAEGYSEETGRMVLDLGATTIQRHPDIPWLGATLDRLQHGSEATPAPGLPGGDVAVRPAPLECKAVAGTKAADWREEPPLGYQVQVQIQMACTGASWGSLCALIGGVSLAWKDLLRHDAFLAGALPKLEEFWLRVKRKDPPEADALPGTTTAIRRLWADEDGDTVALNDPLDLQQADQLEAARAAVTEADDRVLLLENQLRQRLGSATFGALPDGSFLTLKTTERAGYTVAPTRYRALRRWRPRNRRRR